MNRTKIFRTHRVNRADQEDGSILLTSDYPLGDVAQTTGHWVQKWGAETPDQVFLAERSGPGWRQETYGSTLEKIRAIGAALLVRGLGCENRILILSGNGVDHGLLSLAAQYVGIPTVPVAEQYSLIPEAQTRLQEIADLIRPDLIFTAAGDAFARVLELDQFKGVEVISSAPGGTGATPFDALLGGGNPKLADHAFAKVTPDSIAKILMTSGSTSRPKGVLISHRMMCTNQAQIIAALPVLQARPPILLDWLPWNHVFGGNHNFNLALSRGGSLYVDGGKPVAGLFDRTLENMAMVPGTVAFNVPVGFSLLLDALNQDAELRRRFFADLDLIFYAGASLPQEVWEGFETMAMREQGRIPLITSSWGLTETAPAALMQQEPTDRSGVVGVPLDGVAVKLRPDGENRYEVLVKGPTITTGYFQDPDRTAAAFDADGYFATGDAMALVDPADANRGLRFCGRLCEDFKLSTGTWVRTASLRARALTCLGSLVSDLVVTGLNRDEIGLLIFPSPKGQERVGSPQPDGAEVFEDTPLHADIEGRLQAEFGSVSNSSERIRRALILTQPPSIAAGEITAKGNLNMDRILDRRSHLVERLYGDRDPAVILI